MKFLHLTLAAIFCLAGCGKPIPTNTKPTVLVTLSPYAFVVKEIAGDLVDIETLIPQGANPHLYEMPPQKVSKQAGATLWFYLGENFDRKLLQCFEKLSHKPKAYDLTQGIELIREKGCSCSSNKDLHLWMSPKILATQAEKIAAEITALLPEKAKLIEERRNALVQRLHAIDLELQERLASKQGSSLLVAHPAFAYFCRDYGLKQLSIEMEGKEARPADLEQLVRKAQEERISIILTEPQHSPRGALAVAARLGVSTHEIDPYSEDYEETMTHLQRVICDGY